MLYQNEFNYYFDSTKFNHFFNYKPKSYFEGIRNTIEFYKKLNINSYFSAGFQAYTEKDLANSVY
jgi:hypothetical protein